MPCSAFFVLNHIDAAFQSIEVWSDGGPHHFKTKYCQWMWHFLSSASFSNKLIAHNFFASYHGHSLADSHAAADKRLLHAAYHTSELQRKVVTEDPISWGPSSGTALSSLLSQNASRTQAFYLSSIPRDADIKPNIAGLNLIKSKHRFEYVEDTCLAFKRTGKAFGMPFEFKYL